MKTRYKVWFAITCVVTLIALVCFGILIESYIAIIGFHSPNSKEIMAEMMSLFVVSYSMMTYMIICSLFATLGIVCSAGLVNKVSRPFANIVVIAMIIDFLILISNILLII